jgi:hypothetical protein
MLLNYLDAPRTDLQMAALLGLPESRISARRGWLSDRYLVCWVEDVPGPFGAMNGKYGLTIQGVAVAQQLKAETTFPGQV